MSGPKGGSVYVSPEAQARLRCENLKDMASRGIHGICERIGKLCSWDAETLERLRRLATSDERKVQARFDRLQTYLGEEGRLSAHFDSMTAEWNGLLSALPMLIAAGDRCRATALSSRKRAMEMAEALDSTLPPKLQNLMNERDQVIQRLKEAGRTSRELFEGNTATRVAQLTASVAATISSLRSESEALAGADLDFASTFLTQASRLGLKGEAKRSFRGLAKTAASTDSSDQANLIERMREDIEAHRGTVPDYQIDPLLRRWEAIAADRMIDSNARRRLFRELKDQLLHQARINNHRHEVAETLADAKMRLPEEPPVGRFAHELARLSATAESLLASSPSANDVFLFQKQKEALVRDFELARDRASRQSFVQQTVRASLEDLGYRVFDELQTVEFGRGPQGLFLETPDGECLVLQHDENGSFHTEIVIDQEESAPSEARDDKVVRAMEGWCEDYEKLVSQMRQKGVEINTRHRKPPTRESIRVRALGSNRRAIRKHLARPAQPRERKREV